MKPWPRHVPLVALIGIWVLVAFATVPTTVHQVRTVEADRGHNAAHGGCGRTRVAGQNVRRR